MNLDLLLKLVREPGSLEAANQADLEALVQEYPYFTAAQLLLLKLYKQQNSIHFNKQLRKVAALAPSREHVYDLVEVLPLLEEPDLPEAAVPSAIEPTEVELAAPTDLPEFTEADLEGSTPAEAPAAEHTLADAVAEQVDVQPEVQVEITTALPIQPVEPAEWQAPQGLPVMSEAETAEEEVAVELPADEALLPVEQEVLLEDFEVEPGGSHVQEEEQEVPVEMEFFVEQSSLADAPVISAPNQEADADFIRTAHDRLTWFRYFAGKPLREQPEDVLEQLYLEHMQQDLLKAPEVAPETSIKAKINFAEEVESSVSMEEEIKRLAYDSISDDELPASETLARIYEQQNEYKRAIKIYQKLILKFPDKMTYFAGLIEELRKKA